MKFKRKSITLLVRRGGVKGHQNCEQAFCEQTGVSYIRVIEFFRGRRQGGQQLYFTLQVLQTVFKASSVPVHTLRIASP